MEFHGSSKKGKPTKNFGLRNQPQKYLNNIQFNSFTQKYTTSMSEYVILWLSRKENPKQCVFYKGPIIYNCASHACNLKNLLLCNSAIANLVAET